MSRRKAAWQLCWLPLLLLLLMLAHRPVFSTTSALKTAEGGGIGNRNDSKLASEALEMPDLELEDDSEESQLFYAKEEGDPGVEAKSDGEESLQSTQATIPAASKSWGEAAVSATPTTAAAATHRELLTALRDLLHKELQRRRTAELDVDKRGAKLSDIVHAASKLGAAVAKDAGKTTTKAPPKKSKKKKAPNFFVALWLKLRKALPLPAIIAIFVGIGLLLLLLVALIIYCCCCRKGSDRARQKGGAQTMLYKDLDLSGLNRPPFGTINYTLEYDLTKDNLLVTVSNCQDLPKGLDSLDPYVVVSVMSEKDEAQGQKRGSKLKTSKTVKNSSNPVFNFSCVFPVKKKSELKEKVLVFEVFDWDYGIKHDMVARKVVHLRRLGEELDEILGRSADFSKALRRGLPRDERGPGDICLSLYYAAKDMSLTVGIVECKGVFISKGKEQPDLETLPNTFVRLSVRNPQLKKEQVKHSKTVFGARNPYFNEQFVFQVGGRDMLEGCVLRVTLVHKTDTLRIKRPVGSLELHTGADRDSLPLLHWRELLQTPNRAIARWHNLITPEAEERAKRAREKEEKRRLQELQEEAEATAAAAAAAAGGGGGGAYQKR